MKSIPHRHRGTVRQAILDFAQSVRHFHPSQIPIQSHHDPTYVRRLVRDGLLWRIQDGKPGTSTGRPGGQRREPLYRAAHFR